MSTIKLECPKCAKRYRINDRQLKIKVNCKNCGLSFIAETGKNLQVENDANKNVSGKTQEIRVVYAAPGEKPPSRFSKKTALYRSREEYRKEDAWISIVMTANMIIFCCAMVAGYGAGKERGAIVYLILTTAWMIMPNVLCLLASKKTDHPIAWFFLGIIITPVFQFICLLTMLFMPNRNIDKIL